MLLELIVEIMYFYMESFRIVVKTAISHVFFSWVFGFGGKVKIKTPDDVKQEYACMVSQAAEAIK